MELELNGISSLTSFVSELHYSYMELELIQNLTKSTIWVYYIIPIWNWSGINSSASPFRLTDYIIPIWNWSSLKRTPIDTEIEDYIIPIWNWSSAICITHKHIISNYIIPIWNWSYHRGPPVLLPPLITLFLYGIGAITI